MNNFIEKPQKINDRTKSIETFDLYSTINGAIDLRENRYPVMVDYKMRGEYNIINDMPWDKIDFDYNFLYETRNGRNFEIENMTYSIGKIYRNDFPRMEISNVIYSSWSGAGDYTQDYREFKYNLTINFENTPKTIYGRFSFPRIEYGMENLKDVVIKLDTINPNTQPEITLVDHINFIENTDTNLQSLFLIELPFSWYVGPKLTPIYSITPIPEKEEKLESITVEFDTNLSGEIIHRSHKYDLLNVPEQGYHIYYLNITDDYNNMQFLMYEHPDGRNKPGEIMLIHLNCIGAWMTETTEYVEILNRPDIEYRVETAIFDFTLWNGLENRTITYVRGFSAEDKAIEYTLWIDKNDEFPFPRALPTDFVPTPTNAIQCLQFKTDYEWHTYKTMIVTRKPIPQKMYSLKALEAEADLYLYGYPNHYFHQMEDITMYPEQEFVAYIDRDFNDTYIYFEPSNPLNQDRFIIGYFTVDRNAKNEPTLIYRGEKGYTNTHEKTGAHEEFIQNIKESTDKIITESVYPKNLYINLTENNLTDIILNGSILNYTQFLEKGFNHMAIPIYGEEITSASEWAPVKKFAFDPIIIDITENWYNRIDITIPWRENTNTQPKRIISWSMNLEINPVKNTLEFLETNATVKYFDPNTLDYVVSSETDPDIKLSFEHQDSNIRLFIDSFILYKNNTNTRYGV